MAERMTLAQAVEAIRKLQEQVAALQEIVRPMAADWQCEQAQLERRIEALGGDEATLPRRIQERRAAIEAAKRVESDQTLR